MPLLDASDDHGAPNECAAVAASHSKRRGSMRRSAHPRAGSESIVADYALAVRAESSDIATARIIDRRLIFGRRLAADDDLAAAVVVRNRPRAVGRRPADNLAGNVVERAPLRRRC